MDLQPSWAELIHRPAEWLLRDERAAAHRAVLTIHFRGASNRLLGPADCFCIEGPFIRQSPDQQIVCRYSNRAWRIENEIAPEIECRGGAHLQLEDWQGHASRRYGPFKTVQFRARNCIADGVPFAEFMEPVQRWVHRSSGLSWRILNLTSVAHRGAAAGHDARS